MNIDKANKIAKIVNEIDNCDYYLNIFNKSYRDEFEIYHDGFQVCNLDVNALKVLLDFYTKKKVNAEKRLSEL